MAELSRLVHARPGLIWVARADARACWPLMVACGKLLQMEVHLRRFDDGCHRFSVRSCPSPDPLGKVVESAVPALARGS